MTVGKTRRRRRRDPHTRTVLPMPEKPLNECVLALAAPLMGRNESSSSPDVVRSSVELAITFLNAKCKASILWGDPRPKQLNDLTRKMTGKKADRRDVEAFELLAARWQELELAFDPRLVGDWSLESDDTGKPRLTCEMELPDGVEFEIPPALEDRVCINGRFLDKMLLRLTGTSLLSFPLEAHRGVLSGDGTVTVRTKLPTVVALFAEGVLPPKGAGGIRIMVQGEERAPMVLEEISCDENGGRYDRAVLVFKPETPSD